MIKNIKGGNNMATKISRRKGVTVVKFDGPLNYETIKPALAETERLSKGAGQRIVFNFKNARFVGSSNVTTLVKAMKPYSKGKGLKASFCCVNSEFRKVIKAFQGRDPFEMFESEDDAINH